MKTFGQTLQEIRRYRGVSQRHLAEKVGVDFSYISKLENGRLPPPSADTIVRIAQALGEQPELLLSLTGKLPTDLKDALSASPAALGFVRQAQEMNLTAEEWKLLTKRLKRLRD